MKTPELFVVVKGSACGKTIGLLDVARRWKVLQSIIQELIHRNKSGIRHPASGMALLNTAGAPKIPQGNPDWFKVVNEGSDTEPAEITINGFIGSDPFAETANDCKRITEELKAIPADREITVHIHSQGGNVWEGLGIYDALRSRRDKVTVRIGGLAASAATFIAMAGHKIIMPATGRFMIHDAQTWAAGNADVMDAAKRLLNQESDNIAGIYAERTKTPKAEIRAKMKKTTWMTGAEAKEAGFVDEVVNVVPLNCAGMDLGIYGDAVPEPVRNELSAGSGGPSPAPKPQPTPIVMNRKQAEAWLIKRGVTIPDNATDAEVFALIENFEPAPASKAPAAPAKAAVSSDKPTAVGDANVVFDDVKAIKAQLAEERRGRITAEVQKAADECRIPGNQVDDWVNDILAAPTAEAGQKIVNRLKSMPQVLPGVEAVEVQVTNETSPSQVIKHLETLKRPLASLMQGNHVTAQQIHAGATAACKLIAKLGGDYWSQVFNANTHTISSDLKRTVILTQVMRDFKRLVLPVTAFSTRFNNVPLEGTDKVAVRYYPLYTSASKDFVQNDGYVFDKDSTTSSRDVTVDQRKYQPFAFNSAEMNRQPYFDSMQLAAMAAEQLGLDVVNTVLAKVTAANFGGPVKTLAAASFNTDTITDIATVADLCDWPAVGRTIILDTRYKGELLKDPSLKSALESGSDQALRAGSLGRLSGFEIIPYSRIPANGENLKGMAIFKSALLVATAPIKPAPGVLKQLVSYDLITDPDSGLTFEYRYWGSPDADQDREVIECSFGSDVGQGDATFAVDPATLTPTAGNANALMRITSP